MFWWSTQDPPPSESTTVDVAAVEMPDDSKSVAEEEISPVSDPETPKQFQALLEEVELINGEVTAVRKQFWEAKDSIKEKDEKIRILESHIKELLELHEKDEITVKELKEANTNLVEEEAKVRESLHLMKKVLTRSELKAKEDAETIEYLKQQQCSLTGDIREASEKRVQKYKKLLEDAENEIETWKNRHAISARLADNLRAQLKAAGDPTEAARQLEKQRRMIDALEQQIIELELEDMEEDERKDDRTSQEFYDHSVINRAILDEDLEGSKLRDVIQRLDCRKYRQ